jgi:hypothetical protein
MNRRSWLRWDGSLRAQLIEFHVLHELTVADPEPLPVLGVNTYGEHATIERGLDLLLKGSKQHTSIGSALFPHHPPDSNSCRHLIENKQRTQVRWTKLARNG